MSEYDANGRGVTMDEMNLRAIFGDVRGELTRAAKYPPFNSAHEGYAVILEEMDELKAHVWMKQKNRDVVEMRKEASRWLPWRSSSSRCSTAREAASDRRTHIRSSPPPDAER